MTTATAPKKHRTIDRVALLEAQVVKLTASAIQGLKDNRALDTARARINELTDTVAALQRAVDDLADENDQLRADVANARSVRVPAGVRDTSDRADQATPPFGIGVRPLWEALGVQGVAR
ncbi:hypothetical protein [Streptomyces sp. DW26H14]|uniref:hypothetical protein n=1 Tax=Streptomyces sp. DW26H14 TaxID=3435395 RepID=UPI00403D55C8